jgi:hypothetical protein
LWPCAATEAKRANRQRVRVGGKGSALRTLADGSHAACFSFNGKTRKLFLKIKLFLKVIDFRIFFSIARSEGDGAQKKRGVKICQISILGFQFVAKI